MSTHAIVDVHLTKKKTFKIDRFLIEIISLLLIFAGNIIVLLNLSLTTDYCEYWTFDRSKVFQYVNQSRGIKMVVVLGFYVPPTAKVIRRQDLGLKE